MSWSVKLYVYIIIHVYATLVLHKQTGPYLPHTPLSPLPCHTIGPPPHLPPGPLPRPNHTAAMDEQQQLVRVNGRIFTLEEKGGGVVSPSLQLEGGREEGREGGRKGGREGGRGGGGEGGGAQVTQKWHYHTYLLPVASEHAFVVMTRL